MIVLLKAEDDLKLANLGLENGFYSQVCFLSQQCAEKSLKAFILAKNDLYPKTHKLIDLIEKCKEIKKQLNVYKKDIKILDEFYIPTRYPDGIPGSFEDSLPSKEDAKEALETAERIYLIINNILQKKFS